MFDLEFEFENLSLQSPAPLLRGFIKRKRLLSPSHLTAKDMGQTLLLQCYYTLTDN